MPSGPSAKAFVERGVSAVLPVVLEASGVDASDSGEQAQLRVSGVLGLRRGRGAPDRGGVRRVPYGRARSDLPPPARPRSPSPRRPTSGRAPPGPLAEAEARRGFHGSVGQSLAELSEELRAAGEAARDVVADVHDRLRRGRDREHGVERGDAPRLGGRHGEALADVVERARRDPAFAGLRRPQGRQKQVPAQPDCIAAGRDVALEVHPPRPAFPSRGRRAQDGVHGRALRGRGFGARDQVQIHGPTLSALSARV